MIKYSFCLILLKIEISTQANGAIAVENVTTTTTEAINYLELDAAITCKFQPNGYDCDGSGWMLPKFYYDLKLEDCKSFTVGNCPHNLNVFNTLSDCHESCRDMSTSPIPKKLSIRIICRLQHDFGHCNGYHPRWYYDVSIRRCKGFSYSGCGGNLNRFVTQQSCSSACSGTLN